MGGRAAQVHGQHKLEAVLEVLKRERDTRSLESLFGASSAHADTTSNGGPPS